MQVTLSGSGSRGPDPGDGDPGDGDPGAGDPGAGDPPTLDDVEPFVIHTIKPSDPKRSRNLAHASYAVMALGVALSIVIAIIGATQTALVSAMLALVAAGAQVVSVVLSQQSGKPDENHVRTLARRAQKHALRLNRAVAETDQLMSSDYKMPQEVRQRLGILALQLDVTREELGETVETWRDLNPNLFEAREEK